MWIIDALIGISGVLIKCEGISICFQSIENVYYEIVMSLMHLFTLSIPLILGCSLISEIALTEKLYMYLMEYFPCMALVETGCGYVYSTMFKSTVILSYYLFQLLGLLF